MNDMLGVASEPVNAGVLFVGPARRAAWSPVGSLSDSLSYVVRREPAVHPWDAWPNAKDPRQDICPPLPKRRASRAR
jgi:hypothetical protein